MRMKYRIASWAVAAVALGVLAPLSAGDLTERLKAHQGKRVTLVLASGTELSGKLTAVDKDTATLAELSGKEFFDAVVDLDHVQALVYRTRDH